MTEKIKKLLGYVLVITPMIAFIVFGIVVGGWHFVMILGGAIVFVVMLSLGAWLLE